MAILTDVTDLTQSTQPSSGTEDGMIYIDTSARTIEIIKFGALTVDGVTLQALYSFLKEEWKTDTDLIKFPFPMVAITPEQYEFVEGWTPFDAPSRKLIRTGGWAEINASDVVNRRYFGVITLGNIDNTDREDGNTAYYFFENDTSATEFTYAGPVNEAVQTMGDADNGNFDKRTEVFTTRIRTFGNTYDQSSTPDIGISAGSTISYKVERFPLSEAADPVVTDLIVTTLTDLYDDIITSAQDPYDKMTIGYFEAEQVRSGFNAIGGDTPSAGDTQFGVIIDADTDVAEDADGDGTAEEIYAYVQAKLVQTTDINNGAGSSTDTVLGQLAEPLLSIASTGNTLSSLELTTSPVSGSGGTGVYVDSFDLDDKNRIQFVDNDSDTRSFPYVATGSINFNQYLVDDTAGYYWMFFDRTVTTAVADLVITADGTSPSATWTSAGTNLPVLADGDYVRLAGAADDTNNTIWYCDSAGGTTGAVEMTLYDETLDCVTETSFAATVDQDPIDSPDGILVDNNASADIEGSITGSSISFDFDYDGNVQGGRTAATNAPILLRAIGFENAQFIEATGSITRSTGQTFTLVAGLERNYYDEA